MIWLIKYKVGEPVAMQFNEILSGSPQLRYTWLFINRVLVINVLKRWMMTQGGLKW